MASQLPSPSCVSQVKLVAVPRRTLQLLLFSSLASSQSRPCEEQNSLQLVNVWPLKSISAEQFENAVQTLPFFTSAQLSGSQGATLEDGAGVGLGVGEVEVVGLGVGLGDGLEVVGAKLGLRVGIDVVGIREGLGLGLEVGTTFGSVH